MMYELPINPRQKILRYPDVLEAIQRGERVYPINVEVDLSDACQLRCKWCAFAHLRRPVTVQIEQARPLLDSLCSCDSLRAITLTGGGEPTISPAFVHMVEGAFLRHKHVGLYTNGIYIDPVIEVADCLDWVYVSMDEANAYQYKAHKGLDRFWEVASNVQRLAEERKTIVGLGFAVGLHNHEDIEQMIEVGQAVGAHYVHLHPIIGPEERFSDWYESHPISCDDFSWAEVQVIVNRERFEELVRYERREWERGYEECRASALVPCVGADGTVWVCPNTRGLRPLGNIYQESLKEIWERREAQLVGADCRIACRDHALNTTLEYVCSPHLHEEFV